MNGKLLGREQIYLFPTRDYKGLKPLVPKGTARRAPTHISRMPPHSAPLIDGINGTGRHKPENENGKWKISLMSWREFIGLPDKKGRLLDLL